MLNSKVNRVVSALQTMLKQGRSLKYIATMFETASKQAKQYGRTDHQIGMLAWRVGGAKLVKAMNRVGVCPRNPFLKTGRGIPLKPGEKGTPDLLRTIIGEHPHKVP